MIHIVDRNVGRVLDALERRGWLEDSLILFTADHGEMLGDLGKGGKCWWENPSVRVPLLVPHCLNNRSAEGPLLTTVERLRKEMLRIHVEHPAPKAGRAAYSPGVDHRITRERLKALGRTHYPA